MNNPLIFIQWNQDERTEQVDDDKWMKEDKEVMRRREADARERRNMVITPVCILLAIATGLIALGICISR